MKKLPADLKHNIKDSRGMSASDQISPYHVYPRYVFMNASLSNQSG